MKNAFLYEVSNEVRQCPPVFACVCVWVCERGTTREFTRALRRFTSCSCQSLRGKTTFSPSRQHTKTSETCSCGRRRVCAFAPSLSSCLWNCAQWPALDFQCRATHAGIVLSRGPLRKTVRCVSRRSSSRSNSSVDTSTLIANVTRSGRTDHAPARATAQALWTAASSSTRRRCWRGCRTSATG